jgi:hypothetical protein
VDEVRTMDTALHDKISERLDGLKRRGIVSEYLVAWTGRSGHLQPKIAVWSAEVPGDRTLAQELASLLADLGCAPAVTVLHDRH